MRDIKTYQNPVLTGFFPDPSVIQVGEDFYMVNSTFQYFPAIPISHSKDLVHWETVGYVITKNEDLELGNLADSHGIWAPDISHHNGKFYVFVTLRLNNRAEGETGPLRQQIVMVADKPEGPYSKLAVLDVDNIDPSHFVDDDGTHYMIIAPGITIYKLKEDCTKVVEGPIVAWEGTGRRCPEGPHILKKDGYYYAILAEGGTGHNHCITVARAKSLYGPYEECPYNPVLTQSNEAGKIQRSGHGKLVQTQKGDWWVLYLCGRYNAGMFTTLGRETSLDPVKWTEDGWFVVNDLKGPSEEQVYPDLEEVVYQERFFDDFAEEKLGLHWEFVRNPDNAAWSLTERPGYYRIWTGDHDLSSIQAKNTLLRREKHFSYTASLKLDFSPAQRGEQAGLICYYGVNNYIKLYLTYEAGLKVKLEENRNGEVTCAGEQEGIEEGSMYFQVVVDKQTRTFYYSRNQKDWILIGEIKECSFLSDEGVTIGKHHTGTLVGLYANNGGRGTRIPADFDWFDYSFKE